MKERSIYPRRLTQFYWGATGPIPGDTPELCGNLVSNHYFVDSNQAGHFMIYTTLVICLHRTPYITANAKLLSRIIHQTPTLWLSALRQNSHYMTKNVTYLLSLSSRIKGGRNSFHVILHNQDFLNQNFLSDQLIFPQPRLSVLHVTVLFTSWACSSCGLTSSRSRVRTSFRCSISIMFEGTE
jgi:hypothetical protein